MGTGYILEPYQGASVAISADGSTAIIGGQVDSGGVGAAWVFTRKNGSWVQQGSKLVGTGYIGQPQQGQSVAISADGNTAIVGGPNDNNYVGAAWVFIRSNGSWAQQGSKLVGTGYISSGYINVIPHINSVAISADGNTAIIGGPYDNSLVGAAWVFTRINGSWAQQGSKLVGTGYVTSSISGSAQGGSVAISADGNTVIIGGFEDNNYVGAGWVFTRSSGSWAQQGSKLVGIGYGSNAWQGGSVAISADGSTAIIGGGYDSAGAAWVFTRNSGSWAQEGSKLVGLGYIGNPLLQGESVAISSDGNTAIVGGPGDNNTIGATWLFTRNNGSWAQLGSKLVGLGYVGDPEQGGAVAISADGSTVIIGGSGDNNGLGAAWIF